MPRSKLFQTITAFELTACAGTLRGIVSAAVVVNRG
jgi:hypothetical protein